MVTVQQCGAEEIVGQAKWTTNNHSKGRSSSKEGDVVYMVGLEGSPLLWAPSGKPNINSNKYCSQLDQLKAALNKKCPELVSRKHIIFHQDNARPQVSLMTKQKLLELGWEVLIQLPYSPDIAPSDFHYLGLYKILLMEKMSIPWKTVKGTWNSSLLKKIKSFRKMELWSCLKNGRR